jgi:hypothetical protein
MVALAILGFRGRAYRPDRLATTSRTTRSEAITTGAVGRAGASVPFHFTAVGMERADPIVINHEQWNEIFQRLADGQPFELKV